MAGAPCTITGTAGDDLFDDCPYGPGVVICGGAGADRVDQLAGGTFRGGRRSDRVKTMTDGRFVGGRRLTPDGQRVANMLAMVEDEDERLAVLDGLMDDAEGGTPSL